MRSGLYKIFDDHSQDVYVKIIYIYAILIATNLAAWLWAFYLFQDYPVQLGTAFLAYTFGLRHAVDADHIAAIDNVTRKLMQEGKQPIAASSSLSGTRRLSCWLQSLLPSQRRRSGIGSTP